MRKDGLPDSYRWTLFDDLEGNVWVGNQGGLDRLRYRNLLWYDAGFDPRHLVVGDNEKPWLATAAGYFR